MTEITAQLVKKLRTQTGAGMMNCKKALFATNGNKEKGKTIFLFPWLTPEK